MQTQIQPLLQTVNEIIIAYESRTQKTIDEYNSILETKNKLLESRDELLARKTEEMEDFLKVSFASRWKKKSETLETEIKHLKRKYDNLLKCNGDMNYILDAKTEEKEPLEKPDTCEVSTQTEGIEIQTKKTIYTLKSGTRATLCTSNGDVIGNVVNITT